MVRKENREVYITFDNKVFLEESEAAGLMNLKGHRDVGGRRASIYNAVSLDWVQQLVDFMIAFEKKHA